jgi:hypothetical protein
MFQKVFLRLLLTFNVLGNPFQNLFDKNLGDFVWFSIKGGFVKDFQGYAILGNTNGHLKFLSRRCWKGFLRTCHLRLRSEDAIKTLFGTINWFWITLP